MLVDSVPLTSILFPWVCAVIISQTVLANSSDWTILGLKLGLCEDFKVANISVWSCTSERIIVELEFN